LKTLTSLRLDTRPCSDPYGMVAELSRVGGGGARWTTTAMAFLTTTTTTRSPAVSKNKNGRSI
jgi:hypothetical protein